MTFNYNKFKQLLAIGQEAEEQAIKKINKPIIQRQTADNYKSVLYDFMTDDNIKYEVKLDLQSTKTGNIFIEYRDGRGINSGINNSEANNYIIISNNNYYLIEIETLRNINKGCKIAQGKDKTRGYLLKLDELIKNSILL